MGDLGKSILYYERALALQPNFEDAKSNLAFVNSHITDKIEPMERFFISEWIYLLGKQLTSNQWAFLSIITFSLALILLLTYMFARLRWIRKVAFFAGIFSILLAFASAGYSFYIHNNQLHHPEAIVMVGSAPIKSAPDQSGTELFVLHEGTKVTIKSRLGTWVEIRIADGNVGWMPESQITVI